MHPYCKVFFKSFVVNDRFEGLEPEGRKWLSTNFTGETK